MAEVPFDLHEFFESTLLSHVPDAPPTIRTTWVDTRFQNLFANEADFADFLNTLSFRLRENGIECGELFATPGGASDLFEMTPGELLARICSVRLKEQLLPAEPVYLVAPEPTATVVRIFYATDRQPSADDQLGTSFHAERSAGGQLNYGECQVSIPAIHKLGHLESPSILRLEFRPDPERHIVLTRVITLAEAEFLEHVAAAVAASPEKDAFVLVHGYNVTFDDAARRCGQFAFDLSFVGAPIVYSWPANGRVLDYSADEANVIWTAPHLERFLSLLIERSGAKKIHIIAHSMGNRAVCDALRSLSQTKLQAAANVLVNELVLAAPDIDSDTFRELAAALKSLSGRVTLYQSSNDKALLLSRQLHKNPRAGEPVLVVAGVDTIDATEMHTDFLGHSYFSDSWPLLSDIHSLISENAEPAKRFGLRPVQDASGVYWAFRA
jgi:esterase/lipase superfamily enzyme